MSQFSVQVLSMIFADDFIGSALFFVIGGIVLVGLVGLLIYMRKKGSGEE